MHRTPWPLAVSAAVIFASVWALTSLIRAQAPSPDYVLADWTPRTDPSTVFVMDETLPPKNQPTDLTWEVRTVVKDLEIPWDIATLPSGNLLVTERSGYLSEVKPDDGTVVHRVQVPNVVQDPPPKGENGLTGLAIAPNFATTQQVYLYYSYADGDSIKNRVSTFVYDGERVSNEHVIVELPGGPMHNGGRLRIGPDGKLWIPTGEGGNRSLAQDASSLGGKLLRLNLDGSVPADNPSKGSAIYSLGHRNPQGFAWQPGTDRLYMPEHGQLGNDEINRIEAKRNYGWPFFQACSPGELNLSPEWLTDPVFCSWETAIAPSGTTFLPSVEPLSKSLFVAGLRGKALHRFILADDGSIQQHGVYLLKEYGRFRALAPSADGTKLYIGTSNRDGRLGAPVHDDHDHDDRILELTPVLKSQ